MTKEVHIPALVSNVFDVPRSEARRALAQGEVELNGEVITEMEIERSKLKGVLRLSKSLVSYDPEGEIWQIDELV